MNLDKINLTKKYPNYFNKRIFRSAFIIILILTIITLWSTGWNISPAFFECSKNSPAACRNKFYGATGRLCDLNPGLCETQNINPGEIVGNKPTGLMRGYNPLSLGIITLAFVLNHILYKRRLKKNEM